MKKSSKKEDGFDIIRGNPAAAMELMKALEPDLEEKIKKGNDFQEILIASLLRMAVPAYYQELKDMSLQHIRRRQREIASTIGAKGDVMLFPNKKKGASAAVFNEFAEGVTILAMMAEGGVEIFGEKFDLSCPLPWSENQND